ncbi:MAG TPA: NAD(P)-binding domain-containing protein, partial [Bdellovibrionota bacterium]|nr:NAD(P)-binding domain-containing protein [Bdellovibrionota bacterium]
MKSIDTIIIGAGPYGLSVAAHLKAAGVPFRVYGTPLESWASYMPEGMLLRSEPFASNLWDPKRRYTFQRYCAEKQIPYQAYGKPVPIETFLAYAEWFRANAVGETTDVRVTRVTRAEGGFDVSLADGTSVRAKHVVLATGHMAFQNLPAELKSLPGTLCKHSAQIKDVQRYSGRDVTVVGAGQSALETAALIREAGAKVRLVVRKGGIQWNAPGTDSTRSVVAKIRKPEAGLGAGWKILA